MEETPTRPFTGPLAEAMARGHMRRKGHALEAVLVPDPRQDGLWRIKRLCCGDAEEATK